MASVGYTIGLMESVIIYHPGGGGGGEDGKVGGFWLCLNRICLTFP